MKIDFGLLPSQSFLEIPEAIVNITFGYDRTDSTRFTKFPAKGEVRLLSFEITDYDGPLNHFDLWLQKMLIRANCLGFILKADERYYFNFDKAPESVRKQIQDLDWICTLQRVSMPEFSTKHTVVKTRDDEYPLHIEHKVGVRFVISKDFQTLEQRLEKKTFQVVPKKSVKSKGRHKKDVKGSGFLVVSGDEIIGITAKHAMSGSDISGSLKNQNLEISYSVGNASYYDIQELKIEVDEISNEYCFEPIESDDMVELSDKVYVCGYPDKLGEKPTISFGHVSKINATYNEESGLLQISAAAINPNNSGGPVLNAQGKLLGVLTLRALKSDLQNVAFVEPINRALKDLISKKNGS